MAHLLVVAEVLRVHLLDVSEGLAWLLRTSVEPILRVLHSRHRDCDVADDESENITSDELAHIGCELDSVTSSRVINVQPLDFDFTTEVCVYEDENETSDGQELTVTVDVKTTSLDATDGYSDVGSTALLMLIDFRDLGSL